MGIILRDRGGFDNTQAGPVGVASKRAVDYNFPMDVDKYYEGLLYKQDGKTAEALEAFEEAAADDPASALAWNEIGLLYDDDGRVAAAARCYERAVFLDPQFAKGWNNWGVTFFVRGEYTQAKEKFLHAMERITVSG